LIWLELSAASVSHLKKAFLRIFLDTEFTDFVNPKLIAVGLVSELGQEFYAELTDGWQPEQCSPFVVDAVLPCLDRHPTSNLNRIEAGEQVLSWLTSIADKVSVVSDAHVDWHLVFGMLPPGHRDRMAIEYQILQWPGAAMARHHQLLLNDYFGAGVKRHHALVDARALRNAVMQTEADFRK
jgi:hypothetical protein